MTLSRFKIIMLGLFAGLDLVIHQLSFQSDFIEKQFVRQWYPFFSATLRGFSVFFSFSVGDVLYGLLVTGMLFYVTRMISLIIKRKGQRKNLLVRLSYQLFILGSLVYIFFNVCWGFNYNRKDVATAFGLDKQPYTKTELCQLNGLLLQQLNERGGDTTQSLHFSALQLQGLVKSAYGSLGKTNDLLSYKHLSLKFSAWSRLISYWGVSGYYNPFTGEAQINSEMPSFILPFVCCHEVAHQLGYAKENEANFVGYLAAASTDNADLRYAADFDMFLYANRNLFFLDSVTANQYRKMLPLRAKHDIRELMKFSESHQSLMEPLIEKIYGAFLKNNQQPQGLLSYDEVTGLLIAYFKKEGRLR